MKYDVYIVDRMNPEIVLTNDGEPLTANSDTGLLDLVSSLFINDMQEIVRRTPIFNGNEYISIKVYPRFQRNGLALNKTTMEIRRVKRVGVHTLTLFNTDDKYKAYYQENGYILSKHREVQKDDWIPIDETDAVYGLYHAGSAIGTDLDFGEMERVGMETL